MTERRQGRCRAMAIGAVVVAGVGLGWGGPATGATRAEIDAGVAATRTACAAQVPGCRTAAERAHGMLVFPEITEAGLGIGGSYGEGALVVDGAVVGYYSSTSVSVGLQIGAEKRATVIMFMTARALDDFRHSSGWTAGADASVTLIDQGNSADVDTLIDKEPVLAFVFGQKGLMGDLSLKGAKIKRIER